MASGAVNILIDPVNVYWQMESQFLVDFAGVSASDFGGTSFTFYSAKDATQYYVWGDEDNTDVDPAAAGTGIEVDYAAGASSTAIATAAAAAIDAEADFSATSSGTVVTVRNAAVGESTDAADTDSGVAITICRRGKDFDLGLLQGDVELNFSPANFVVQAHQTGVTPRAALYQGIETLEVSTVLQETINSKLQEIYGVYGTNAAFTPAGGSSNVFGVGNNKQGNNLLVDAGRLILRPVSQAAAGPDDKTLMLALPVPDTLVFSGENPRTLSVTWQGYLDDTIDSRVSALTFGDASQL
jgi:hypothetical protein